MASTSFLDEITLIRSQAFLAKDTSSKGADRPKRRSNRQYLRMLAARTFWAALTRSHGETRSLVWGCLSHSARSFFS